MPIKLNDLQARTGDVDVYRMINGPKELWGKLNVTFLLNPQYTLEDDAQRSLDLQSDDPEVVAEANAQHAVRAIVDWDLLGDDDKKIPVEADHIRTMVPTNVLTDIITAIGKARSKVGPTKKR